MTPEHRVSRLRNMVRANRALVVIGAALVSACAAGPVFHRPPAPDAQSYSALTGSQTVAADTAGGEKQHFAFGVDVAGQWWRAFASPQIDAMVAMALEDNPDLEAAQAALRSALETAAAQRGSYFPALSATASSSSEKDAVGTLSPTLASGASPFRLHTAQVDVGYSLDVFGGNRRQVESLTASAEAQRFQTEACFQTLVSDVILAAIGLASAQSQLAISSEIVADDRESLQILQKQYQLGSISFAVVKAQEAALAQTEASLPGLEQQLVQQRNLLAQLTGKTPGESPVAGLNLSMLTLPQELPLGVPAQLVEHRPDVRAAEAALHAATAQVGVAVANLLPGFSLTAGAGSVAVRLSQLMEPATRFWSLGASLSQTVFAGGTLVHRKRAAVANMDQAAAQYRSTVLNAFREVADTLAALQGDAVTLEALARAEAAAAETLAIARHNLQLGSVSYLELYDAQRNYSEASLALVQARAARLSDTVALFQALGGGWWNRAG